GVGYRRACWLLKELFHVEVSKSSLHRWVEEIAATLPKGDEMIKALNERNPITEAHFDEIFPRGTDECVLVLKDEHGRIIATKDVEDGEVSVNTTQPNPPWGLDRVDQRNLPLNYTYTYTNTGAGVNVYVIDTGIRPTHQEFGGRASIAADFVGDGQNGNDCN